MPFCFFGSRDNFAKYRNPLSDQQSDLELPLISGQLAQKESVLQKVHPKVGCILKKKHRCSGG